MMRAMVSTGPPAAYGTTRVTGRVGQSWLWPVPALSAITSAAAAIVRIVVCIGFLRCSDGVSRRC
jgi:hypothetical protein